MDGGASYVGCSPWECKKSDTTERLHFTFYFRVAAKVIVWVTATESSLQSHSQSQQKPGEPENRPKLRQVQSLRSRKPGAALGKPKGQDITAVAESHCRHYK